MPRSNIETMLVVEVGGKPTICDLSAIDDMALQLPNYRYLAAVLRSPEKVRVLKKYINNVESIMVALRIVVTNNPRRFLPGLEQRLQSIDLLGFVVSGSYDDDGFCWHVLLDKSDNKKISRLPKQFLCLPVKYFISDVAARANSR